MKLLTIDNGGDGAAGVLLECGEILHLARAALPGTAEPWLPAGLKEILCGGAQGLDIVRRMAARAAAQDGAGRQRLRESGALLPGSTPLLAPIPKPGLVLAAGLAYRSHLAEMAGTPPPPHPTGFIKSPHSVTGPHANVAVPPAAPHHIDYEGELAVVFGRRCHAVTADEALDHVAGYTVANDISARDWVRDVWSAETPWDARRTWEVNIMGKQYPGFTPLGPVLLTADEVPDAGRLRIITRLNGRLMQDAPVSDMLFSIAETIAHFSRWYAFEPGDVLLTGTPAGVGAGRMPPVFMADGDVIEVAIEGIGALRNVIRANTGERSAA
ncbi:MAG: fumarylacetoacetate hydrolase family protein [Pseudomonadota bacterium]